MKEYLQPIALCAAHMTSVIKFKHNSSVTLQQIRLFKFVSEVFKGVSFLF